MAFTDTVLIVDDVAIMRSLLKRMLIAYGYENISEASSGEEALKLLEKSEHSLVLLDINMPGISGIRTLKAIRESGQATFVVMVSSHSSAENVRTAIEIGANGFIVKPYTQNKVGDILEKYRRWTAEVMAPADPE